MPDSTNNQPLTRADLNRALEAIAGEISRARQEITTRTE
jgi:hypothetical protein